jgi:inorganic pyrophosphatase
MNQAIECLAALDETTKCANVVVEAPKGSRVKYVYTPETGLFRVKRILPEGMVFPFNYGFIPSTLGQDGDPLDIVILNEEPVVCGCLLRARPVRVLRAEQTEKGKTCRNDRILAVIVDEETPPEQQSVRWDEPRVAQIGTFFATYNQLSGKTFKTLGTGGSDYAEQLIRDGAKFFENQRAGQTTLGYDSPFFTGHVSHVNGSEASSVETNAPGNPGTSKGARHG